MRATTTRRTWLAGAGALAMAAFATPALAQAKLKVVATFSILGDMVAQVGGERIELTTLVGPDADAHTWQPTPAAARALAEANVLVVNGLGFEGWIDRLAQAAPFRGRRVVASDGVPTIAMESDAHGHGHGHSHGHAHGASKSKSKTARPAPDPHAWQDIANGRRYVAAIARGLAAADPAGADAYARRAADVDRRLAELDAWTRAQIATVPADKRKAIMGHEAFRYFGRAYGVTLLAPAGVSTDAEPTAKDLAALARQVRDKGVRAIFLENMGNPRLVEQLARDTGATVGGTLYVDALSAPGGPADTYEKMFRHNVPTLVAAMARN